MNTTSPQARATTATLALGVGCQRGISQLSFERGVLSVLAQHRLALDDVAVLASIDSKVSEPAIRAFAAKYRLETRFFSAAALEARAGRTSRAERVHQHVATHGVSEPAALLAAGAETLLVTKTIYRAADASHSLTVAIAAMRAARGAT